MQHFKDIKQRDEFLKEWNSSFVDFLHTERGKNICLQIFRKEKNTSKIYKVIGEHISNIIENACALNVVIDVIDAGNEDYVKKYIFSPIKHNMTTFLEKKCFVNFIAKLLDKNKFEYLKEKFIEKIYKNKLIYEEKYKEIIERIENK